MSFFYAKSSTRQRAKAGTGKAVSVAKLVKAPTGPKTALQTASLNRLGCRACPLNSAAGHSPKMTRSGAAEPLVYFLGEAPGKEADQANDPFAGQAGDIIRGEIPPEYEEQVAFDNCVHNRTPRDRAPTWVEVESCRPNIISAIEEAKPKVIVGVGPIALNWALGTTDINGYRGRFFAIKVGKHKCWFFPILNPAFILKNSGGQGDPMRSRLGHCIKMDLKQVFDKVDLLPEPSVHNDVQVKSNINCFFGGNPAALIKLIEEASEANRSAVDIETQGKRPYSRGAKVLSVAISFWRKKEQVTISFGLEHKDSGWGPNEIVLLKAALLVYLRSRKVVKVAHHTPFELEWLISLFESPDFVSHADWEDTMMQGQFLDERLGETRGDEDKMVQTKGYLNLDFLVFLNFGIHIKALFKFDKKNMQDAKITDLLLYNGIDAKYTLLLDRVQIERLLDEGVYDAYVDAIPRSSSVAIMQWLGVPVNRATVKANQDKLQGDIDKALLEISEMKVVKAFTKEHGEFKPESPDNVLTLFKDFLHRPEVEVEEKHFGADGHKGKRLSVDKTVLTLIDHPLAKAILALRNKTKLKSTYVDILVPDTKGSVIFPDDHLHANFNVTGPETGRTSSDEPNMQNWPKRNDSWVRNEVDAGKGHVFISVDYGQLEACGAAMCSKDKHLVEALWNEYDIHIDWAVRIGTDYPKLIGGKQNLKDKDAMKKFRSVVKNKMVFPVIFGATTESVAGYLNAPLEIITPIMEDFWERFSGIYRWQKELMAGFYKDGYVATLNGRRRHYPLSRNQAINHPVQGTAAEIVCNAMDRLSALSLETDVYTMHPRLNVHDDLTFKTPSKNSVIDDALAIIVREMLTCPYSFVNVPLSIEVSMGPNWYDMKTVGKFFSNRDL